MVKKKFIPEFASRADQSEIVGILERASKLKTLNYKVNNVTVSQNRLLRVANAIRRNKIPLVINLPLPHDLVLAYAPKVNWLIIPRAFMWELNKQESKSLIVHEGIHISNDIDKLQNLATVDDEASAYIAQILYHYSLCKNMDKINMGKFASRGLRLAFDGAKTAAQCILNGTHRQNSSDSDFKVAIKKFHYRLRSSSEYGKVSNLVYNNYGIDRRGIKYVL